MKTKRLERRETCQRYTKNIYIRHRPSLIWRWDPEPSLTSDGLWVTRAKWGCSLCMAVRALSWQISQAVRRGSIRGKRRWGSDSDEGAGSRGNEGSERYEESRSECVDVSRGPDMPEFRPGSGANAAHAHLQHLCHTYH